MPPTLQKTMLPSKSRNEEDEDEDRASSTDVVVAECLAPHQLVTKMGRGAWLLPTPARRAKVDIAVSSLAQLNAMMGPKNDKVWPSLSLSLAHFHVVHDRPEEGKPRAFFSVNYDDLPESDTAKLTEKNYIDENIAWAVPKGVGPRLAKELSKDESLHMDIMDDGGSKRRILKPKWQLVVDALSNGSEAASPSESNWTKFPTHRFVTRRTFPKTEKGEATTRPSAADRSEETGLADFSLTREVSVETGEVATIPANVSKLTFVPFDDAGAPVTVVHMKTGIAVYQHARKRRRTEEDAPPSPERAT
jgi:hypothetical protein